MSIQSLNDSLRQTFLGGKVCVTQGILALPGETQAKIERAVRSFDAFTEENDPHGEHDFGIVDVEGVKAYWKVDYYDKKCTYGSEDPADPSKTTRVLTILRPCEY